MGDKLGELYLGLIAMMAGGFGWVIRNVKMDIHHTTERVDSIESKTVDRDYLEAQLMPIRADVQLIKKILLEERRK